VGSRDTGTARDSVKSYYPDKDDAKSLVVGSYEDVLGNPNVEAIYIPLPNSMHAQWAIEALKRGKHVLVEKPIAITSADAQRVFEEARKQGLVAAEALMYRHHPQTLAVKKLFNEKVGVPMLIRAIFHSPVGDVKNIRMQKQLGGGALFDLGIYPVSYAQFLMNGAKPHKVFASWLKFHEVNEAKDNDGVDKLISAQLYYKFKQGEEEHDVVMQMSCSFALPYQSQVEIHGTNGKILITRPFTYLNRPDRKVWFTPNVPEAELEEIHIDDVHQDLYVGEFIDMFHAIRDHKTYTSLISHQNSLDHIETLEALAKSARLSETVNL
jgi:xylose dehydrogenase (NAD/NADP)